MPIVIDANVLVALFREATDNTEKVRINGLLADAKSNKKRLVIPSPALAEFAVKALQHEMDTILGLSVFQIAPFDTKSAIECGNMLKVWATGLDGTKKDRHKAKFDMQILAIAKSLGASLLVTGDKNLLSRAAREKIQAKRIIDLSIPDSERQIPIEYDS